MQCSLVVYICSGGGRSYGYIHRFPPASGGERQFFQEGGEHESDFQLVDVQELLHKSPAFERNATALSGHPSHKVLRNPAIKNCGVSEDLLPRCKGHIKIVPEVAHGM